MICPILPSLARAFCDPSPSSFPFNKFPKSIEAQAALSQAL
jgi:hypothetical protein